MKNDIVWDQEVDVLIVGSGFAGLSAAIEAKSRYNNVMIIEKMKAAGGNSIISDGGIAAPNTHLQNQKNIADSKELMYQDMIKAGLGYNNPILLKTLVEHAKEAFKWTIDSLEVPYLDRVDIFGGHSVARCYTPVGISGGIIIRKMMKKINELCIPIKYSHYFQSILVNDQHVVIGAVILKDYNYKTQQGTTMKIKVNKGIILASGGYGADVSFRQIQIPRLTSDISTTNKPFATAEVLKSALSIGAGSVQLSHIQLGAWSSPDEKGFGHGPLFADYILFQYGVIIDPITGKRFINELIDRKQSADALLNIGHPCIGIADDEAVKTSGWDISKAVNKNVVVKFDSLKQIAEHYDIPFDPLRTTIKRYNNFVKIRHDKDFQKPIVELAKPIETKPYYVMRLWPKVHFTMGGLLINEKANVLDFNGNIIKNLYAAGEVVGGVHGASRLGSCSITECIVFGRIAGQNI